MSYEETQLDETPPGELENQRTFAGTVSSNLTHAAATQQLTISAGITQRGEQEAR